MKSAVWVVDFGSQYTQLITRRLRELGYSSEITTVAVALSRIQKEPPKALVLSGGPNSVFEDAQDYTSFFANSKLPVLGVCYGMQLIGKFFNGKVERGVQGEYGVSKVRVTGALSDFAFKEFHAWMSHSDHVMQIPSDFAEVFKSDNGIIAGIIGKNRPVFGIQFHPEVHHTEHGKEILQYFLAKVAMLAPDWNSGDRLKTLENEIRSANPASVLCAFSGGVDSLVAAKLFHRVFPERLSCVFVDHGLLRPQDEAHIEELREQTGLKIEIVRAKDYFLSNLAGVKDPETKRKIIGKNFIEIFEKQTKGHDTLLQGTIYPDVIESMSPHEQGGKSATIKSHHNVGGLPEKMNLKLLEPLRYLFKDEVRELGLAMGLKEHWLNRHPFPGPGLAVRIVGEVTEERLRRLKLADQIFVEEMRDAGVYRSTWQAFPVYLPIKSVGVKGDGRVYEEVIALRAVNSVDGMTATVTEFPWSFLVKVSSRIVNEVPGITRVVYDITQKPPGTIEWE